VFRKIRDNPRLNDPEYLALWIWLLTEANWQPKKEILGGKTIECQPGQFTTGRKQLSKLSGINESKIERLLNLMEIEQQIEQQKTSTNRLITITNWKDYQQNEQQIEQQVNNDQTTIEQQVNTPKEVNSFNKPKKNIYTPDFESFWAIYPRPKGKKFAFKAWILAIDREREDTIITGVKKYIEECKGNEERFIKHPATWLNGDCWFDEPTKIEPKVKKVVI